MVLDPSQYPPGFFLQPAPYNLVDRNVTTPTKKSGSAFMSRVESV